MGVNSDAFGAYALASYSLAQGYDIPVAGGTTPEFWAHGVNEPLEITRAVDGYKFTKARPLKWLPFGCTTGIQTYTNGNPTKYGGNPSFYPDGFLFPNNAGTKITGKLALNQAARGAGTISDTDWYADYGNWLAVPGLSGVYVSDSNISCWMDPALGGPDDNSAYGILGTTTAAPADYQFPWARKGYILRRIMMGVDDNQP
jgi:hypothetical protein